MILIKEEIRRRVANLEARRNDLLESLKGPALLPSEMCKVTDRISQLNFAIYEFNSLLENHTLNPMTAPIQPGCVFYDYVGERFEVVSIEYYKS